jgi:hypothetical protein
MKAMIGKDDSPAKANQWECEAEAAEPVQLGDFQPDGKPGRDVC